MLYCEMVVELEQGKNDSYCNVEVTVYSQMMVIVILRETKAYQESRELQVKEELVSLVQR